LTEWSEWNGADGRVHGARLQVHQDGVRMTLWRGCSLENTTADPEALARSWFCGTRSSGPRKAWRSIHILPGPTLGTEQKSQTLDNRSLVAFPVAFSTKMLRYKNFAQIVKDLSIKLRM
jgi:hypothetical protein